MLRVLSVQISQLLRHGCTPVAVLDGKTPPEKLKVLQGR